MSEFNWLRINNDINGNPRYVTHFLNFLTEKEISLPLNGQYKMACKRSNLLGGRKYHTKSYGGGIVFQSYNIEDLEKHIIEKFNLRGKP